MTALTITHTSAEGTLIDGTAKGDGSADALKANGWRWGRSIGSWFIPRSRDTAPKRAKIDATVAALNAAGFTVDVDIDATPRDGAEVEADAVARGAERAERLDARADRHAAASDAAYARVRAIGDGIPFGQPILLGHHSQARAERDARRMRDGMDKTVAEDKAAREDRRRAAIAADAVKYRNGAVTVGNRIEKLRRETNIYARSLAKLEAAGRGDSPAATSYREEHAHRAAQLDYWQAVRAEQISSGTTKDYGRHNVTKGDAVKIRGYWNRVERANAKSVTIKSPHGWDMRYPWHEVIDHRAA
ncbi:DUF3560 domain-containing protein [Dermacoccus sp. 147Ba]|uniref:DUF3560 domain-containing protein n=1 Tax=Dermacoccus sp. 147Ba TaxID=2510111 RepID=UPI00101BA469|nr:DUF3560 domain-containing protein [Dermacoccus sp. 147Ba]RYI20425.1 DUF3560 domain-containing protein [Dermacoccus sp. 147Ba]